MTNLNRVSLVKCTNYSKEDIRDAVDKTFSFFGGIENIIKKATKPVSICGELAANTQAISKLLYRGIETLSVSPKSIAQTKEEIRDV